MISLALWVAGIALIALALWRGRAPMARMAELDRLAENARRYESWRGGSRAAVSSEETTGADVMRRLMRRQAYLWAAVGALGIALIAAGFIVR